MERAVNECREANGEKPYGWKKGKITEVTAYMSYNSRGQEVKVEVPDDHGRLLLTRTVRSISIQSVGN